MVRLPAGALFQATGGTTLIFRLDYTVQTTRVANTVVPDDDKIVDGALAASMVHVTVEDANGNRGRTMCPTYETTSVSRSQEWLRHLRGGVPVTCRIDVTTTGRAKVEAEVAWLFRERSEL